MVDARTYEMGVTLVLLNVSLDMIIYCDMSSDSLNSGARGNSNCRQWLCKQETIPEIGNESDSNN
jgi:hypothetical protein